MEKTPKIKKKLTKPAKSAKIRENKLEFPDTSGKEDKLKDKTFGLFVSSVIGAVLFVVAETHHMPGWHVALFKFMAIAPIVVAAFANARSAKIGYAWLIFAGLTVGLAADMAILFSFAAGLGVFLVGHVIYIAAFKRHKRLVTQNILWLVPYLALGGGVYYVLWPALDTVMSIAVAAYITAISVMAWQALDRCLALKWNPTLVFAVVGSILFMISDSVLSIGNFQPDHPIAMMLGLKHNGTAIMMATYVAAQWSIMMSAKD